MRIRVVQAGAIPDFPAGAAGVHLFDIGILSHHISPGDGLLVYVPNDDFSQCRCIAACEVIATDTIELRATLDVRQVDHEVVPASRARWRWKQNPYLCPDKNRVRAYGLIDILAKAFNDHAWHERKLQDAVREVSKMELSNPTLLPVICQVYLFGPATLGTKIGKSVDVAKRKKELERDVGEQLEVLHQFSSDDYSRAEFILHLKYSSLRREGEGFDLTPRDISEIQSIKSMNF